jgi:N-methylhydantoinase B/oxoprolinase/acetone carboxylase alpha subunit
MVRAIFATVDFSGTALMCVGSVNAVCAITESAIFYVFRCLLRDDVAASSGLMRPIRIIIPPRSMHAADQSAVVADAMWKPCGELWMCFSARWPMRFRNAFPPPARAP